MKKRKKNIKKLGNKIKNYFDIFFDHIEKTDFLINHFINFWFFISMFFNKWNFYKVYSEKGVFSQMSINFSYYTFLIFFGLMVFYSWHLIYYKYYIKKMEEKLSREWYVRFLEDEYKITYQPFLNWLWFFVTLIVSFMAIYLSIISMQISIDSVNNTWKIDIVKINSMFETLWTWLWVTIWLFVICYFYYRWNIISKNNYVKKKYYSIFNKNI